MDKKTYQKTVTLNSITTVAIFILSIYNGYTLLIRQHVTIFGYISYIANIVALVAMVFEWWHIIKNRNTPKS